MSWEHDLELPPIDRLNSFRKLKQFRGIVTRYDKDPRSLARGGSSIICSGLLEAGSESLEPPQLDL
jgi:hypothetical protein